MSSSHSPEQISAEPLPVNKQGNQLATAGLVISTVGFIGWLMVLTIIVAFRQVESNGGSNNLFVELNNFFNYLLSLVVGLLGLSINGTLSIIGTTISLLARKQGASAKSTTGLFLGIAGLAVGTLLILWRMWAWGLFSAGT